MKKCLLGVLQLVVSATLFAQTAGPRLPVTAVEDRPRQSRVLPPRAQTETSPVSAFEEGFAAAAACTPTSTALCLNSGRFRVTADWRRTDGSTGQGTAVSLTNDTGYFWFFNSANVEAITKVLNGCSLNNAYWVFASGLTNVEVTLNYTDTVTGTLKTYRNPLGTAFQPVQDTSAFQSCSVAPQPVNVTGTWDATLEIGGYSYDATLSMVQTGTNVTGTVAIVGFGAGSLFGSVSGQSLDFTINEITPCAGTFSGSVTIGAGSQTATGTLSGSDCYGFAAGTVDGSKQYGAGSVPQNTANVTGTWVTTLTIAGLGQVSASITMIQSGTSVTGTGAITGYGLGSLTGSVSGQNLSFTIHEFEPCPGTFTGGATISGNNSQATGSGSGADCAGTFTASISATKL